MHRIPGGVVHVVHSRFQVSAVLGLWKDERATFRGVFALGRPVLDGSRR